MDRSRLPSRMGTTHFIARLIALALSYASLTLAFYLACTHALLNPVLYTTLVWCLVVDSAEVLSLITKPEDGIGRVPTWLMLANETLVISLFIVGWVVGGGMMVDVREEGVWKRRLWLCVLSEV